MKNLRRRELLNQALSRAWNEAHEEGIQQHKSAPNLLLAEVWHIAAHHLEPDRVAMHYFVEGYSAARRQLDKFKREQEEANHGSV
jgi:hypothetical protein